MGDAQVAVAEMFMANEPLKPYESSEVMGPDMVAEMFMANEPLKLLQAVSATGAQLPLQRCLWRMSH